MAEAHEQALGILADRTLKLALHLQEQAMDVEDPDQKVRLSTAFHRVGRGLRQTLALQARMAREARRGAAEAVQAAAVEDDARRAKAIPEKKQAVRRAVERLVWTEYERGEDEADQILDDLNEFLDAEAFEPGFLETPTDVIVSRLARTLELPLSAPSDADADGPAGGPSPGRANGHAPDTDTS